MQNFQNEPALLLVTEADRFSPIPSGHDPENTQPIRNLQTELHREPIHNHHHHAPCQRRKSAVVRGPSPDYPDYKPQRRLSAVVTSSGGSLHPDRGEFPDLDLPRRSISLSPNSIKLPFLPTGATNYSFCSDDEAGLEPGF